MRPSHALVALLGCYALGALKALLPTGGAAYTLLPSIVAVVMQLAVFVVRNATGIVTGKGLRVIPEILVDNFPDINNISFSWTAQQIRNQGAAFAAHGIAHI
ncbi:hypothetical protein F9C07_1436898 [Aspergillus flavus]|uniref:Uncharacterized protein n=1 Tax=Aspergillus flavus (strain ATCC 200026 / FGSC A1120 / IAM 13836 / NRRL 3357 / JCM 12722 / SRRC 167) TaxID=332952 RepID=A0A7U2QVE6_ASPFN|nr:hypothetical protein F9C07_1436898 [Aspergillus flavus]